MSSKSLKECVLFRCSPIQPEILYQQKAHIYDRYEWESSELLHKCCTVFRFFNMPQTHLMTQRINPLMLIMLSTFLQVLLYCVGWWNSYYLVCICHHLHDVFSIKYESRYFYSCKCRFSFHNYSAKFQVIFGGTVSSFLKMSSTSIKTSFTRRQNWLGYLQIFLKRLAYIMPVNHPLWSHQEEYLVFWLDLKCDKISLSR